MPVYVKVVPGKGSFRGTAQGQCEYYDMTNNIVMKGTFTNGILTGTGDILVRFTDTSFTYFIGAYVNNLPDGSVTVYEYNGTEKLTPSILTVTKFTAVYNAGTEISRTDVREVQISLAIQYKKIGIYTYIINFSITET